MCKKREEMVCIVGMRVLLRIETIT
ncbi:hypothetical protein RDI58_007356 [Solanum bulbocastanum]|uniref:Uncharacterized protein n=1 Tax=Solanum bulbocastanum TaxID=147425 RepID=A0AAN8YM23_SOLBU